MKAYEAQKKIADIQDELEWLPYDVWTVFFEDEVQIQIYGDQVCFGSDFKSIKEVREALAYLVDQFGGTTKWKKL